MIRRFFVGLLTLIGAVTLLLFLLAVGLTVFYRSKAESPAVRGRVILEMDLGEDIPEYAGGDALSTFIPTKECTVLDVVRTLEKAARDDRVAGLYAKIGSSGMGLGKIQEIRSAVLAFREKGKPAIAFSETFGEFGPGNGAYYLATAFDRICLQPSGDIGLTGLAFKVPFLAGTLEKLGITPRMDHRGEYKTAMNMFTEKKFTEAHYESLHRIMASQFGQMTAGIGKARGFSPDEVRALVDRGPFSSEAAKDAGLVDDLAYSDAARNLAKGAADPNAVFYPFTRYVKKVEDEEEKSKGKGDEEVIALIYGVGAIHRGKSELPSWDGDGSVGSDTLGYAFRKAVEDDSVRAILFRIDSPGGSYVASDSIWREVGRAREAGKPVIVSMGDVAGSGGYFIAAPATRIVAQPGALTGSIGVFAGKPVMTEFWKKLGVSWDEMYSSEHADMWSTNKDYDPEEWARFEKWLDRVYKDFVGKVAQGRGMQPDKVEEVARGRVWTGEDAKDLGLVDELGGFPEAIRLARREAGIPDGVSARLKIYPPSKSLVESLTDMFLNKEDDDGEDIAAAAWVVRALRPYAGLMRELKAFSDGGVLTMPYVDRVQ
ncbi:MAG: signal peptide peptidase SppA [Syntrophobacteraceae bacterium]